ncbi:hypothetical protein [Shinella zoogloeoides]|uniref:Uncharacterized protein n=1 Tax=Shinella zoogloeoides TaxID=352475 RepID=A0A6N8TG14_SHIZO|nr:hypothetical protein [Shinella zoogloeoides]MXO01591.1 hypothetical protein [Shinella zoogloeoides]UEX82042.1 hypothetical protein K8M09_01715 [Shinella zoogloeoides]
MTSIERQPSEAELFIIHGTANDRQKADERAAARAAAEARKQAERDAYTAMVASIARP